MASKWELVITQHNQHSQQEYKMLYHGLIVIGTSAILLLIYNLIIVKWCATRHAAARTNNTNSSSLQNNIQDTKSFNNNQNIALMLPIFKFKKLSEQSTNDDQCAVCLSIFEDGEDLKLLPKCKHSFHNQCINMWFYSHFDCPICRASVLPSAPQQNKKLDEPSVATARLAMDPLTMV